jgi:hypothetical protein
MKALLSLMQSRKAWITLFGVIVSVTGVRIGINPEQIYTVAGLCALLVLSIAHEDFAGKIANVKVNLEESEKDQVAAMEKAKAVAEQIKPVVVAPEEKPDTVVVAPEEKLEPEPKSEQ